MAFDNSPPHSNNLQQTFMRSLLMDVSFTAQRRSSRENASGRRELVRALFVAIEGVVWVYRTHVMENAKTIGELTPAEEAVLLETAYWVTAQGKIVEQTRFVPMLALLRLVTRIAQKTKSSFVVDFEGPGWNQFREALEIRNRLTHPKSEADLLVDKQDLEKCLAAFDWIFELCLAAMEATNIALAERATQFRDVLEKLKIGDAETIAEYHATASRIDGNN